ncbi:MAG: hypothetical protein CME68_08850 [Halobacteriovoraceae bacterium]|nr:hypothetical protein [Halobacteriovoraceae bacterium]
MVLETDVQSWLISQNSSYRDIKNKKPKRKASTIAVTSGKGGVGKTTISLKMSKVLSKMGYRVLLIDCDYNLSNTVVKLGIPVNNNFFKYINKEKSLDDCIYKDGNFHLISGCNGSLDLFNCSVKLENSILEILGQKESCYDYILLDCPAGISKENLIINAYCDYRIVVVVPDKSSITDSYSLIKILSLNHGIHSNHLLLNKITSKKQYNKIVKSLGDTVQNFIDCRLNILGGIPSEKNSTELFEEIIFNTEKTKLHEKFCNVIKKFTDEASRTPCDLGRQNFF